MSTGPMDWKMDDKYKALLQPAEAKIICDDAEKAFNDSIETSFKILDRNSSLLQLVAGIIVGLVAYSIGKWEKTTDFDSNLITAISGILYYFLMGLLFIFPNIRPRVYILPGTQPKKLVTDIFFYVPVENREILLYITKITNLQEGITVNRAINDQRWVYYKKSLNFLFYSPIVLIFVYLLAYLLIRR